MALNLDTRLYTFNRPYNSDEIELTLRERLPENHLIRIRGVNQFLGSAQQVYSEFTGYDYEAPVESVLPLPDRDLVARTQAHLRAIAPALGFGPNETPEFVPDPYLKKTTTGQRVINLQQYHRGIPVFQMERAVWMESDGTIYNVTGASVGLPGDLDVLPNVNVEQALKAAVTFLFLSAESNEETTEKTKPDFGIKMESFNPRILAGFPLPSQPCVLAQGQLGEAVPAYLVFFYQGETTRLGWHMIISAPGIAEQYAVVVEARTPPGNKQNPEILYSQKTSKSLAPLSGKVWKNNPKINTNRESVSFPRPKSDYPIDSSPSLPVDFPLPWTDGAGDQAAGNCTIVVFKDDGQPLGALPQGVSMNLNPADQDNMGDQQRVLNAFYFCNFLHDFFYTLGFNEQAGNFQRVNANGEGKQGDPLIALVSNQPIENTARMTTLADGSKALLEVGTHRNTTRPGALDADVIFHEYTHGVTDRMVGSGREPQPLQRPQSRGMSEGWSDYFALTIQNFYLGIEREIIGDWITGDANGLRLFPYNDTFASLVGGFGIIGTSAIAKESHDIGRIWCAALMKMNRDLAGVFLGDKKKGHLLGWQIVIAGLQLTPANSNYLQGRDAIIEALKSRRRGNFITDDEFKKAFMKVWTAFTHFGMGANAKCSGSELSDIIADTDLHNIPAPTLKPAPTP